MRQRQLCTLYCLFQQYCRFTASWDTCCQFTTGQGAVRDRILSVREWLGPTPRQAFFMFTLKKRWTGCASYHLRVCFVVCSPRQTSNLTLQLARVTVLRRRQLCRLHISLFLQHFIWIARGSQLHKTSRLKAVLSDSCLKTLARKGWSSRDAFRDCGFGRSEASRSYTRVRYSSIFKSSLAIHWVRAHFVLMCVFLFEFWILRTSMIQTNLFGCYDHE